MSDFLDRLVARALGGEPVLAPRLPAWFEPPVHTPWTAPANDPAPAPEARVDAPHPRAVAPTAPQRHASPSAPQPDTAHGAPAVLPIDAGARPRAVRSADDAAARAPRTAPPLAPDATATHRSGERAAPRAPGIDAAAPALRALRTPSAPQCTSAPAATLRGTLQPPPAPVFAAAPAAPPAGRAGHVALRARSPAAAARAMPQPEPVVHVTIGRLEVRAAPAPAAPPRHSSGPRPTSLDDYLRQRSGGPTA